jgi:hypothetical protein
MKTSRPFLCSIIAIVTAIVAALTVSTAQALSLTVFPGGTASLGVTVPAVEWTETTDSPTGISVMLPGRATVEKTTTTDAGGKSHPFRLYTAEIDSSQGVLFGIIDFSDGKYTYDFDKGLKGIVENTGSGGAVTNSRRLTVNGHPALDGRFTATFDDGTNVGLVRIVSAGKYVVVIETLGPLSNENELSPIHQRVLGSLRLP